MKKAALVGPASDVFAMGLILYQMKHGKKPTFFQNLTGTHFASNSTTIKEWYKKFDPIDREDEIIKKMLDPDPSSRLEAKEAYDQFEKL